MRPYPASSAPSERQGLLTGPRNELYICSMLVSRLVNKCSIAEAAFDFGGRFGPAERARVLVPVREPAVDGLLQPAHAVKAAAPDRLLCDQPEPALDQVEPGSPGRSEVKMEARMRGQPLLYCRMLVGAVIVADQVDLASRIAAGQRVEERNELHVSMAVETARVNLAGGHLQRGEQTGGAVAGVIMGAARGQPRPHRQQPLGAVERLDLGFFVHAQHQRPLGRVQIEPNNVGQLAVELGVGAELEGFHSVRLQPVLLPDAMHARRREPYFPGQPPHAPMGGGLGLAQGRADNRLFLGRTYPARSSGARQGAQASQPSLAITTAPQADRTLGNIEPLRQRADALAVRAAEHDSRSRRQRLRCAMAAQPRLQLPPICSAHFHSATLYWT